MDAAPFRYRPSCSMPDCEERPGVKLAARWSNGVVSELKTYGLACDRHRDALLERARASRLGLRLDEGETLGEVAIYVLQDGARDVELLPLSE